MSSLQRLLLTDAAVAFAVVILSKIFQLNCVYVNKCTFYSIVTS